MKYTIILLTMMLSLGACNDDSTNNNISGVVIPERVEVVE